MNVRGDIEQFGYFEEKFISYGMKKAGVLFPFFWKRTSAYAFAIMRLELGDLLPCQAGIIHDLFYRFTI